MESIAKSIGLDLDKNVKALNLDFLDEFEPLDPVKHKPSEQRSTKPQTPRK